MNNKCEFFFAGLGNGTTVCNKAIIEHGDYKKIAHISEHGVIKFYISENDIPKKELQKIKKTADNNKQVFLKQWNKKDYLQKWTYMMNLPIIGCGYNKIELINEKHNDLPIAERVPFMEQIFFETHM